MLVIDGCFSSVLSSSACIRTPFGRDITSRKKTTAERERETRADPQTSPMRFSLSLSLFLFSRFSFLRPSFLPLSPCVRAHRENIPMSYKYQGDSVRSIEFRFTSIRFRICSSHQGLFTARPIFVIAYSV